LDTRTRGAIEKLMDDFMQRVNISSDVRWIGNEYPIKSIADVALGLAIGAIETLTVDEIFRLENRIANDADLSEMREILKRRLPEITSKIKFELNI
jgi:hypothetical protein